jgi:nicotinate-nucleotide adenylyltransferase
MCPIILSTFFTPLLCPIELIIKTEYVKMKNMRIGIFGGAFDPFHEEHKRIIGAAKTMLSLDSLIVLPSYYPPHKNSPLSKFESRLAMVTAGCEDFDYVTVDCIEYARGGVNPTHEVLPLLKEKYGVDNEYYFIIGGDSVKNFHTWIEPQKIADMCTLVAVEREGVDNFFASVERLKATFSARVIILPLVGKEVSSSVIRAAVALGIAPPHVSQSVLDIILKDKLYTEFSGIIEKLKGDVTPDLFNHMRGTVMCGMKLNAQLNLDYKKVFIACLLHDCAKQKPQSICVDAALPSASAEIGIIPPKIVHQYTGAKVAEEEYGVHDADVLNAIRYHTTGKGNMTSLEKLVYTADVLEEERDYEGVDELRKIADKNFQTGFVECVKSSVRKLQKEGNPIFYLTLECLDYYRDREN